MNSEKQNTENIDNIYRLDGRVPLLKAIPFGLQHVLAMFVSNLAPITIVAACVVSGIGLSLFTVGVRSFGGGYSDDFGSPANLFIGTVTLVVCIIWSFFVKGYLKQLSVLAGLIVGYIISIFLGKVDLSTIMTGGLISFPHFLMFIPKFNIGSILSVFLIFMVSATETIGDTTAMVSSGLKREITTDEISGSLAVDGYASSISSLFGCPPVTSFSQNVGLISMTKVVNRFTIMTGAVAMILGGLIPPIGNFFASLPQPVLGGCTIMMFGQILVSGIQMIAACGFDQRNIAIASLSLALGAGLTASSEQDIWKAFPQVIQDVFSNNIVAVVFIIAMILSYILPEEKKKDNG